MILLILISETFNGICIRRLPALVKDGEKRDNEAEQACSYENEWVQANAVAIIRQPITHEIVSDGHRQEKGEDDIHQECLYQLGEDLPIVRSKYFPHGYFQRALLDEVSRHRQEAEQGDQYGDEGKDTDDLREADLGLEAVL